MELNFRFQIDDQLAVEHAFICGGTGSGKSTRIKIDPAMSAADRVIYWDPDGSHPVAGANRANSVKAFKALLFAAMASGKPFKIACSVTNNKKLFQAFCACVVRVASSDTPIALVLEEIQEVTGTASAEGYHLALLSRGRKYGVRVVSISPRPQQCDKTTVSSAKTLVVCALARHQDREYMGREIGKTPEDIRQLAALNVDQKRVNWYECEQGELAVLREHNF